MKRIILFRGFHPDENGPEEITLNGKTIKGRWVQGDFCRPCNIVFESFGFDEALQKECNTFFDYDVIPETVGQYIGIDDKNDKKIFEDDIAQIAYNDFLAFSTASTTGNIVYKGCCFELVGDGCGLCLAQKHEIEVIGNIFSNPELIQTEER